MSEHVVTQAREPKEPREGLEAVVALRRLLEKVEAAQVENAYVAGWTWAQVAEVLREQASRPQKAREAAPGEVLGGRIGRRGCGSIFDRFTRGARSCVESVVEEARSLGHDSVGDENLLLGILEAGDGDALEALLSLGVTPEAAREAAERLFADALASVGISLGVTAVCNVIDPLHLGPPGTVSASDSTSSALPSKY